LVILPGTIVSDEEKNEYIVENFIGNGAFGNVYKGKKMLDDTTWAIKTISANFEDNTSLVAFTNEINMATKINNENVIRYVYAHDGITNKELPPYIIMEYANQGTLKNIIDDKKSKKEFFKNEELMTFFSQLINGMNAINSVLVHRDIKPDNILVDDSCLKISDFGLSKVASDKTRTLTFKGFGHIRYTAPEGWKNDKNTIQMDIYSMGLVFYELATLQFPYKVSNEGDVEQWKNAHLFEEPVNPNKINYNITPVVSGIIMKMLQKSVNSRFSNWDDIKKYLETDKTEQTDTSNIINSMLKTRLEKDNAISKKQLEEERKRKEEEDFCKIVKYQFKKDIYAPVCELIDTFNSQYPNGKISIDKFEINNYKKSINVNLKLVTGKSIYLKVEPILESDFIRTKRYNDGFGEISTRTGICIPTFRGSRILAWGGLYTENGTGFNILLIEKKDELYGEWLIMENTNSGLSRSRRIEPFAFELNELEKEIQYVNSMHIYNSKITSLNIEKFYEFISFLNM
jgi:serine/threonine protein kinase